MKQASLILTSDWHLRESIPECRTDDFWTTQWKKVAFVSELQDTHNCPVLHAGDLFHHWKPSPYLLSYTIAGLPSTFNTIYGQHDLPQHNWENRDKSGIHTLSSAGAVHVLKGANWGQDPRDIEYSFRVEIPVVGEPHFIRDILVWHHMVWQGVKPYPGCADPSARAVLRKYPQFDLILTGDNHKPFVEKYESRILVNPGSLTRQTAAQIDHSPRVYLYYADDNTVEPVYLPIEGGVVSRDHIEKDEQRDQRIESFISKLSDDWKAELSFEDNLRTFFGTNKVRKEVKELIYKHIDK